MRPSTIRHADYYSNLVRQVLDTCVLNDGEPQGGEGKELYAREQDQINTAIGRLLVHDTSPETDAALINFGEPRSYLVCWAVLHDRSYQQTVRRAAIAAAGRLQNRKVKARLLAIEAIDLQLGAKFAKMRGDLTSAEQLIRALSRRFVKLAQRPTTGTTSGRWESRTEAYRKTSHSSDNLNSRISFENLADCRTSPIRSTGDYRSRSRPEL